MKRTLAITFVLTSLGCADALDDGDIAAFVQRETILRTGMSRTSEKTTTGSTTLKRGKTTTVATCTPITSCPSTSSCGTISNGCGGTIECGGCAWPTACGAEQPNVCGGIQPLAYGAPRYFPVDGSPSAIAAADLDQDGNVDLIASLYSSDGISVMRGDGAGGFSAQAPISTGDGPRAIAVLDVTQDGRPDLVVAHALDGSIKVLANQGNNQFAFTQTFTPGIQPTAMVAADLDGDGRLDVATALGEGSVAVMKTAATGGLLPAALSPCGVYPSSIDASDVDGDGDIDLVVANQMGDSVTVLTNDGTGTFSSMQERAAGQGPVGVTSLEMSAGARPSLLVANRDMGMLHLLKPDGSSQQVVLGVAPRAVMSADLDGDVLREAAVAHADGTVMIVKPASDGTLSTVLSVRAGTAPAMVMSEDVNGDGRPDLITANGGSNDVTVHLNVAL